MPAVLRPEQSLVLLLAPGFTTAAAEQRARDLAHAPLDWGAVRSLVFQEDVLPLFFRNARRSGCALPPDFHDEIATEYRMNAATNVALRRELLRVCSYLQQQGIRCIPLKGPVLAEALYGDGALRRSTDIDLLVPAESVPRAIGLCTSLGYQATYDNALPSDALRFQDNQYALIRSEGSFRYMLELHWGLTGVRKVDRELTPGAWRSARQAVLDGIAIWSLEHEYELFFLCAHAARHSCQGLKWLVDVHDYARVVPLDWPKLWAIARRGRCVNMIRYAFSAAHYLFETPIPSQFLPIVPAKKLRLFPEAPRTIHPLWEYFLFTRMFDSPCTKAAYLAQKLFSPNLTDRRWITLPARLAPAYYLVRPVRLALKFFRVLTGSAGKEPPRSIWIL